MKRLLRSLVDIGPCRLQRRLRHDTRQRLDRALPPRLAMAWAGGAGDAPRWRAEALEELALAGLPPPPRVSAPPPRVRFAFLNDPQELDWPIRWHQADWLLLWEFHLHYFDWARDWLDEALATQVWPEQASLLEPLIDAWITANLPGRGAGWQGYTTALRIRNWIWLLRCCPTLATPARTSCLWKQLLWLQSHPEHGLGGNHWLEHLIVLAIGGLQFDGDRAQAMHRRALMLLARELPDQLLADGGHEERSASYTVLLLDRLVELACVLQAHQSEGPPWLLQAITALASWTQSVRLSDGSWPRFNDSAADSAPPLDTVVAFALAWLGRGPLPAPGLRSRLLAHARTLASPAVPTVTPPRHLIDLPDTGWTLLRPGDGWELCFKCGRPCPDHLPAHVHSDQLSLDLFWQGEPLLIEAGTSVYGTGPLRAYERSGTAHNVLQLGRLRPEGGAHWIEAVEVWHGFRAGRKARPMLRACGRSAPGRWFAEGSHDGFQRHGARHRRRVDIRLAGDGSLHLDVSDRVTTMGAVALRLWWHLGPLWQDWDLPRPRVVGPVSVPMALSEHDTWTAQGFGRRQPRRSLCFRGQLPPGEHLLTTHFTLLVPGRQARPAPSKGGPPACGS
jgi:uncharacterized heparinase superfamily protein